MATPFAFVAPGNASGNPARRACTVARPAGIPAGGQVAAREPHVDLLWRLSTSPWARARTALVGRSVPRVVELLETVLLASTAFGMAVLTVIALAAG